MAGLVTANLLTAAPAAPSAFAARSVGALPPWVPYRRAAHADCLSCPPPTILTQPVSHCMSVHCAAHPALPLLPSCRLAAPPAPPCGCRPQG